MHPLARLLLLVGAVTAATARADEQRIVRSRAAMGPWADRLPRGFSFARHAVVVLRVAGTREPPACCLAARRDGKRWVTELPSPNTRLPGAYVVPPRAWLVIVPAGFHGRVTVAAERAPAHHGCDDCLPAPTL